MSDAQVFEWIDSFVREKGVLPGVKTLRKAFGFGHSKSKRLLKAYLARRETPSPQVPDGFLQAMGVARGYEVTKLLVNKWGKPGQENTQVKVWLSPDPREEELAKKLQERLKKNPLVLRAEPNEPDQLMAVVGMSDLHVGMLAWAREVHENYDIKVALERAMGVAGKMLHTLRGLGVGRILFPLGNDIFHSDNHQNTTTAGAKVDVDGRWQKAFLEVGEFIVALVGEFAKVAPVHVSIIPGNHDYQRAFYLGEVVRWYFRGRNEPVIVDNAPRLRKYFRWGKVLIGLTHGSWLKVKDLPLIMANEAPQDWGESLWKEWFIGHFHRRKEISFAPVQEEGGVRIRIVPALAPPDAWHYQQGFVAANREAILALYHATGPHADFYFRP